MGAAGASVGTIFIVCDEATIPPEYKQTIMDYGEKILFVPQSSPGSCAYRHQYALRSATRHQSQLAGVVAPQ